MKTAKMRFFVAVLSLFGVVGVQAAGVNLASNLLTMPYSFTATAPASAGLCQDLGRQALCLTPQDTGTGSYVAQSGQSAVFDIGGSSSPDFADYVTIGIDLPDVAFKSSNVWQVSVTAYGVNNSVTVGFTNIGGPHFQYSNFLQTTVSGTLFAWTAVADATPHSGLNLFTIGGDSSCSFDGVSSCTDTSYPLNFASGSQLALSVNSPNGDPSYTAAFFPAAVPIPAAVWLFGSGLVGLVGIARRKSVSV